MSLDKGRKCEEKAIKKEKTKKFQLFLKKVLHVQKKYDIITKLSRTARWSSG